MGCWDETCAITRLPIRHDTKCVLVLTRGTMDPRDYQMISQLTVVYKGTYDDYGWINEKTKEDGKDDKVRSNSIFFDEFAWDKVIEFQKAKSQEDEFAVNRFDSLMRNNLQAIDIRACMDPDSDMTIGKLYSLKLPELWKAFEGKIPEFTEEFIYVADYCDTIRRDLLGSKKFKGAQDWEYEDRELVFALERELQDRLYDWYDKENRDFERPEKLDFRKK